MLLLSPIKQFLLSLRREVLFWPVYNRFREFTMVKERPYIDNLQLVDDFRHVPGCFVECGVWRGGMAGGIASVLGADRKYFLFDSYEGLPDPTELDGAAAFAWQKNTDSPDYHDNCTAEMEWAQKAMAKAGVTDPILVKGWFDKTIPGYKLPGPIAILRLDGDWYDSIITCLEGFFDQVAPGGLILIDDYHTWEGCSKAVHDFLSQRKRPERIVSSPYRVAYIVKQ